MFAIYTDETDFEKQLITAPELLLMLSFFVIQIVVFSDLML